MSLEISKKIMKAIILSIKDDFNEQDYAILEESLEKIKQSEEYKAAQMLWELDGYKQILQQREYQKGFCSRLLFEYHKPISEFEIFIEHCITIAHNIQYPCEEYPSSCNVLKGICARSILIANEILCLVKNGFASGALARWRTLYEYSVISLAIIKFGEDVAKKYIAYQNIINYSEAKTYNQHAESLGFELISDVELNTLKKASEAARNKYSELKERQDYSWAKPYIQNGNFAELAKSTDINYYRPFYRFSCSYVHGSINGLFNDIGQIYGLDNESSIKLARTNYGFTDPIQLTMLALLNIISSIVSLAPDINYLLQIICLQDKTIEIAQSCYEVEKSIKDREILFRELDATL